MKKSQAEILADTYEGVRKLTKFYFSKVKDIDVNKRWNMNGVSSIASTASPRIYSERRTIESFHCS